MPRKIPLLIPMYHLDTPANKSDDESDMKLVDTLVHDSEQNPEALYIDREVTDNLEEKKPSSH